MALVVEDLSHAYDRAPVLNGVSLTAKRGELTCLLGASGCGKSTLLRLVAGLLHAQSGTIMLDERVLSGRGNNLAPEDRGVGLIFQEGAIFPHLSVARNVGFGLKGQSGDTVDRLLKDMQMDGFGDRFPHTLSGGQRQRVAIARALAVEPDALLLDEPFASVDIVLRRSLRRELRRYLRGRDCASLMVTHDPEEALEIADQIVVLEKGHILQAGRPEDLLDLPRSLEIGRLLGDGQVVRARRVGDLLETSFGNWPLSILREGVPDGWHGQLLVRQWATELVESEDGATVEVLQNDRARKLCVESTDGQALWFTIDRSASVPVPGPGEQVAVRPRPNSALAFP